jgi:hypothetical protein
VGGGGGGGGVKNVNNKKNKNKKKKNAKNWSGKCYRHLQLSNTSELIGVHAYVVWWEHTNPAHGYQTPTHQYR